MDQWHADACRLDVARGLELGPGGMGGADRSWAGPAGLHADRSCPCLLEGVPDQMRGA